MYGRTGLVQAGLVEVSWKCAMLARANRCSDLFCSVIKYARNCCETYRPIGPRQSDLVNRTWSKCVDVNMLYCDALRPLLPLLLERHPFERSERPFEISQVDFRRAFSVTRPRELEGTKASKENFSYRGCNGALLSLQASSVRSESLTKHHW